MELQGMLLRNITIINILMTKESYIILVENLL